MTLCNQMLDIDRVTRLIEEAAHDLVTPRFRHLLAADVQSKATVDDPEDIVTTVDRDVEAYLTAGLTRLMPGAGVIGEESSCGHDERLALIQGDQPIWVIDPIDGTRNFARGDTGFGIMVALVAAGETRAAWIHLPARHETFVAEKGNGTFMNGTRARVPIDPVAHLPRGTILSGYMPALLRDDVIRKADGQFLDSERSGAAAIEYTTLIKGTSDFVLYYRLLPWDHAAPALMLVEAGGCADHVDGRPYSPRSQNQLTVVARDAATSARVRGWFAQP